MVLEMVHAAVAAVDWSGPVQVPVHMPAVLATYWPGQDGAIPNPEPVAPPGAERITQVIGYLRWGAGAAIIAAFFAGLAMFTGGRILDHQRFGRMGSITMVASVGAAFLYAIGYTMLSTLAAA